MSLMNFNFLHRPETRKFNYKPQFYNPDEPEKKEFRSKEAEHAYELSNRIHINWDRRRQHKENKSAMMKSLIWVAFVLFLICLLFYKFFLPLI